MLMRLLAGLVRSLRDRRIRARQRWQWFRDEVYVAPGSVVSEHAVLGRRARVTVPAWIDPCTVGPYTLIGRTVIRSANHHMEFPNLQEWVQRRVIGGRTVLEVPERPVTIGAACWISDNVTILPEVTIGDGAVIGAGAVVTKSVPPYAIAVGNPARVVRTRYPEEIVELVKDVTWWDWSDAKLRANQAWFELDLTRATADEVRSAIAAIVEA